MRTRILMVVVATLATLVIVLVPTADANRHSAKLAVPVAAPHWGFVSRPTRLTAVRSDGSAKKRSPRVPVKALPGFVLGPLVTIATAPTPMQMPSSVVEVGGGRGVQRLIGDFSAHHDNGRGIGNIMVYSDDGGASWSRLENNPMPALPTINLTKLANGTLLATGFHTYSDHAGMTVARNQALFESAVSVDNGEHWSAPRLSLIHI